MTTWWFEIPLQQLLKLQNVVVITSESKNMELRFYYASRYPEEDDTPFTIVLNSTHPIFQVDPNILFLITQKENGDTEFRTFKSDHYLGPNWGVNNMKPTFPRIHFSYPPLNSINEEILSTHATNITEILPLNQFTSNKYPIALVKNIPESVKRKVCKFPNKWIPSKTIEPKKWKWDSIAGDIVSNESMDSLPSNVLLITRFKQNKKRKLYFGIKIDQNKLIKPSLKW